MSKINLAPAYDASAIEDDIYRNWEESGFFSPENLPGDRKNRYVVAMPPPNVTGVLHLGHALENSILDTEIRYRRMKGDRALLIPGTDHAAVATQARVEDNLKKAGMKNPRQELGREGLLKEVRQYAESSRQTILSQIRKMGTSCDWNRLAYTIDEKRSKAVTEVFRRMFADGLIYRGYRVVNWSVKGQSTCSDDELIYVDQKTKVYTFKYSYDFPIAIATTRPETKLGDTAVAVNPKDERYAKYIGQKFTVELGAKKPLVITIIGDDGVDMAYGTGAVGVTPAHSQIDFEMYQKNKAIGLIKVIGPDGRMTEEAGLEYAGLKINEAREKFVSWLKEQGLYIKEEEVDNNVGTSDRFGDIVESLPMDQWFIDVNKKIPGRGKSLKELMQAVVTSGHNNDKNKIIAIKPERYHESYLHWIENLRDWCISRQIWWGHRIPVWYCDDCKEIFFNDSANPTCPRCQSIKTHQDEDTLDTWFSSGLWTFSTLGWPDDTQDMKDFHPTDWMQMGYEILFFWMARMILMTTYVLDDIPFKEVFIHGILRDKNGKKFSKSLGNGIDPLDVVAKYGTDALRFCLLKSAGNGNDAKFYEEKVESARNFVNKFWNISRFIFQAVEDVKFVEKEPEAKTFADRWILTELKKTINAVDQSLDKHEFSYACDQLYDFTWDYFADWYLEISKVEKNKDEILLYVLQNLIRLWHPMMPFITEELWKYFATGKMLMISSWPETQSTTGDAVKLNKEVDLFVEVIKAIRNLRSENKIEPAKMVNAVIYAKDNARFISEQLPIIQKLARLDQVEIKEAGEKPEQSIGAMVGGVEIFILLAGLIDVEAEKKRLTKELEQTDELVSRLSVKLSNGEFVNNAPVAIVEKEKAKLAEQQEKLNKLKEQLASLK